MNTLRSSLSNEKGPCYDGTTHQSLGARSKLAGHKAPWCEARIRQGPESASSPKQSHFCKLRSGKLEPLDWGPLPAAGEVIRCKGEEQN